MKFTPRPSRNQGNTIWDIAGYVLMGCLCLMLGLTALNFLLGMVKVRLGGDDTEVAESTAPEQAPATASPAPAEAAPTAGADGVTETAIAAAPAVPAAPAAPAGKAVLNKQTSTAYTTCVACHGADGKGIPGTPDKPMAPALVGSEVMLGGDEQVVVAVLKGISPSGGYLGVMVGQEALLDDEKIANAITHARNSWGNEGGAITAERVAEIRARWASYPPLITRDNLGKVLTDADSLLGGE